MVENQHFYWEIARSSGIVSFWLLWFASILGVTTSSRPGNRPLPRAWFYETHRFASILALAFTALHGLALIPDPATDFDIAGVIAPGLASWRPVETGLGIVAAYGLLAVAASFYVKRIIGQRMWRAIHLTSYAAFVLALLHGVYAGSDSSEAWMRASYYAAGLSMFAVTTYRILATPAPRAVVPTDAS